ncbi:MAG TPA: YtxH domain-containing protein [Nitrolancea sp.]|nr:YtxH domain-containing protein [Nitrolancea sp.]
MLDKMRVALKFMTVGVLIGIFFAPRRGSETRRDLLRWTRSSSRGLLGGVSSSTAGR